VAVSPAPRAAAGLSGDLAEVQADVVSAVHLGLEEELGELLGDWMQLARLPVIGDKLDRLLDGVGVEACVTCQGSRVLKRKTAQPCGRSMGLVGYSHAQQAQGGDVRGDVQHGRRAPGASRVHGREALRGACGP